jgi:HisJ family histidinol phosphate phosphatase
MIDYHIHTYHSIDAEGTVKDYCDRAVRLALDEICITNHCELDPVRDDSWIRFDSNKQPMTREGLKRLEDEIIEAKEVYKKSGLTVKFGLEVGYYDGIESSCKKSYMMSTLILSSAVFTVSIMYALIVLENIHYTFHVTPFQDCWKTTLLQLKS